jgi:N-acetylglucosamine-6-phosphate deacetylase
MSSASQHDIVESINTSFERPSERFVIAGASKVDAMGEQKDFWLTSADGVITATGSSLDGLEAASRAIGIDMASVPHLTPCGTEAGRGGNGDEYADGYVVDAQGMTLTPGLIDIHSHGGWGTSFDDGRDAILNARAVHAMHGTTRQVLSLITNPLDVMEENLRTVGGLMDSRPDILGSHLEGPFISPLHKGAHDPQYLQNPTGDIVESLLSAARTSSGKQSLRQITIAPELEEALDALNTFRQAGVTVAVGHTDVDYEHACEYFDDGATLLTHVFNAMNGIAHRAPGPIVAAEENLTVSVELIDDGFHVQDPVVKLAFELFPHRLVLITDSMAAAGCEDGHYKLGGLDVDVVDGHARLVSNGAIAGSTLTLDHAVRRAIQTQMIVPRTVVEAATFTPAKALGLNVPNDVTGAPLGLLSPGFAADAVLFDTDTWNACSVWCAGRQLR